ncbi:MAG: hypothetical protein U0941_20890 [Planctomycetaceae bacterium]
MSRTIRSLLWCYGLAVGATTIGAGCSHMIENRAITAFSKNLKEEDLEGLMKATTGDFRQRALRTATAFEDLKILHLPDGKTTIVEVEEISDDKKRVTVQVGDAKKEVFYELAKDKTGHWVVDDIYLKQKRKGVEAYKSVTEQMDLLLSVREFLDTWSRGDREQVLGVTSESFRAALDQLPPSYLASMTRIVSAGKPTSGKYKPNAQLDEKVAVVRLPRLAGDTVISMERVKGHWVVSDVAVDSKGDDQLPSMLKLAHAVNSCTTFLAAYGRGDKASLAEWSSTDFYEGSLAVGELSQVKLPDAQFSEHELQVKLRGNRADFVLKNDTELVQIDMHRDTEKVSDVRPKYRVSDVTIYEVETKQEKRLSALFTAQGMLDIFVRALAERDVTTLRHTSTRDLAGRVWSKLTPETMAAMPLDPFDAEKIEFVSASFQGSLTKIDVRQGGRPLTYLLREEYGRFFVDDVNWQITGIPASFKTTMEILVPIQEFAAAINASRDPQHQQQALERLQATSTSDFNRTVWSQTRFVPNSGMSADTFLKAPLKGIAVSDQAVTVQLGDNRYGAKVQLRREFERYVIDDVQLIAGVDDSQRVALKHSLRTQLARGEARRPQEIMPANYEQEESPRQIPRELPRDVTDLPEVGDPFASDPR